MGEVPNHKIELSQEHPALLIGGAGTVGTGIGDAIESHYGAGTTLIASRKATPSCDILDLRSVQRTIEEAQPAVIFHLAAATDVNKCETEQDWATALNITGTANVVVAAERAGIPIVFFSTDFVFPGNTSIPQRETDAPNPWSVYGRTKLIAEQVVLESTVPHLVARISYPWYPVSTHLLHAGLKDTPMWILRTLLSGSNVQAYTNVVGNWTSMRRLGQELPMLMNILAAKQHPILHLAGDTHTPFEVAVTIETILRRRFGIPNIGEAIPAALYASEGKACRPQRGGLDTSLAQSLGVARYSVLELLETEWITEEDIAELIRRSSK